MEEKDRKIMLGIAKRLGEIEEYIRFLKGSKQPSNLPAVSPLVGGSRAASKFFGADVAVATEPECKVNIELKEGVELDAEEDAEMKNGQKMLRQAVMEYCEEFDIKHFRIDYIDPTPLKEE